ncbi:transcriptional regulator [Secundilactobacillus paracollinoides]|uniref:Transcriptional regulator n=1 Tax=Secundilactobacillus paracollinoides TaxID=240427 RepID=A0A1B2J290_9LACO|nr:transcriptional regulator [Secundilactobacillus paracollinoides]ANZ65493.1 transcriptional regulator [Secundilactobacillus paracollinoides]ANZ68398.1 transcriptional regulator [Secundilactobacillus paracollinoides]
MKAQATKWKLAEALKTLMATTPFNKITIELLTQQAQVTRNTFYYHFEDLYALLEWTFQREIVDQLSDHYLRVNRWQDGYRLILAYIADNRELCLKSFHSLARDILENTLYDVASRMVAAVVLDVDAHVQPALRDAIVNFFGWALVMQLVQWLANGLAEPQEALVKRAETVLDGSVANAIHNGQKLSDFGQTD